MSMSRQCPCGAGDQHLSLSPWISFAYLARCTGVQLATPSISSNSSWGEMHSFFLKTRISMKWVNELGNKLHVDRQWRESRKTAFHFYIQPGSPMLQLVSPSPSVRCCEETGPIHIVFPQAIPWNGPSLFLSLCSWGRISSPPHLGASPR